MQTKLTLNAGPSPKCQVPTYEISYNEIKQKCNVQYYRCPAVFAIPNVWNA